MSSTNNLVHRPDMKEHKDPNPVDYETDVYQKGLHYEKPPFTFRPLEWESMAMARMSAESTGYVVGSAGTGETAAKNRKAFEKWSIVPSRLVPTEGFPDLSVKMFDGRERIPFPIGAAPVGVLKIFNPDGECAVARACEKCQIPYIMSTASSTSIEEAAKANGTGVRWFQLYWPSRDKDDITVSLLNRASVAGFSALFVTLDTYVLGWRPSDMDNGYNPFLRSDQIGVANGFSDPVFRKQFKEKHGAEVEDDQAKAAAEWTRTIFPGMSHSWQDIKFLQEHWQGPIILKGIQSVQDAQKAAEIGVRGIVVSNHGGRQVDGGVGSLSMLPRIADAVGDRVEIIFDSGIRCGADVAKAVALGAKMVLVGRPYVYGLVLGGEEGVSHVLRALSGDLDLTLHLAGINSASEEHLNRTVLVREDSL